MHEKNHRFNISIKWFILDINEITRSNTTEDILKKLVTEKWRCKWMGTGNQLLTGWSREWRLKVKQKPVDVRKREIYCILFTKMLNFQQSTVWTESAKITKKNKLYNIYRQIQINPTLQCTNQTSNPHCLNECLGPFYILGPAPGLYHVALYI